MLNLSDQHIVNLLKEGSVLKRNEAMSQLYQLHFSTICNYILTNSGSEDDAADIFQDSLVVFYLKVKKGSYQGSSSIGTYLYAIAKNLWLKRLRKTRFDFNKLEIEKSYHFDEDSILQSKQLTIRDALEQIGENCKELLLKFYFKKMTMNQLMNEYGLGSERAARNKKYRCMQRLINFVEENKLKKTDFLNE